MPKYRNYSFSTKTGKPLLLERIIKSYIQGENEDLTPEEELTLKRWKVVQMLSLQHRPCISNTEIKRVLKKEFGVDDFQASRDVIQAQKLFGSVNEVNRQFKRASYVEWLEQIASLSEAKGDYKSAVAALKQSSEIMKLHDKDVSDEDVQERSLVMNIYFGDTEALRKKTIDLDHIEEIPETEFKTLMRAVDRPRVDIPMLQQMIDYEQEKSEL